MQVTMNPNLTWLSQMGFNWKPSQPYLEKSFGQESETYRLWMRELTNSVFSYSQEKVLGKNTKQKYDMSLHHDYYLILSGSSNSPSCNLTHEV